MDGHRDRICDEAYILDALCWYDFRFLKIDQKAQRLENGDDLSNGVIAFLSGSADDEQVVEVNNEPNPGAAKESDGYLKNFFPLFSRCIKF